MPRELDRRVLRFQQIKAAERARATEQARKEEVLKPIKDQIRAANPGASETVVEQILQAHLRYKPHTQHIRGRAIQIVKV